MGSKAYMIMWAMNTWAHHCGGCETSACAVDRVALTATRSQLNARHRRWAGGHTQFAGRWHQQQQHRQSLLPAASEGQSGSAPEAEGHKASLEDLANELLAKDPEAAERLKRVEAAAQRVAKLQATQAELAAAMRAAEDASTDQSQLEAAQAQRASERMSSAEVAAAEKLVEAAELELLQARVQKTKWSQDLDESLERIETGKAAAVAGAGGLAAGVPLVLLLTREAGPLSALLSCGTLLLTCLLFGTVYRYALRQDTGNAQLKAGMVAAFGLARALGAADQIQTAAATTEGGIFAFDVVAKGMAFAGESMLAVSFAAVALEYAFDSGFVKPFGTATAEDE